jgi:hypothetical protein
MKSRPWFELFFLLILGMSLVAACGGARGGGTSVWIDVPLDGLTFPDVQAIKIEGHAASPGGVSRIEIWINGALLTTVNDPPKEGDLAAFHTEWTPPDVGEYTIQAVALDKGGASSSPDSARVVFGESAGGLPDLAITSVEAIVAGYKDTVPFCNTRVVYTNAGTVAVPGDFAIQFSFDGTPQWTATAAGGLPPGASAEATFVYQFVDMHYIGINLDSASAITESSEVNNAFAEARICGTPTAVVTLTPTPTPTALSLAPVIQFQAVPPEIQAGACTTLRWHVENVQKIIFGGVEQPFDGSYKDCLCKNERYTLTVNHLDGSQEKRTVDIGVTGVCETPTPENNNPPPVEPPLPPATDTTPPPAPNSAVPANGLVLSCRSTQTLAWLPVTDPSGISAYYVKLEMEVKPGQWRSAGGYGPISGKQVNVNVQCGGIYRWMVRAQDGAGNYSDWSPISTFSVILN